jgi:hypothetical protein
MGRFHEGDVDAWTERASSFRRTLSSSSWTFRLASKLLPHGEAWPDGDEGSVMGLQGGRKVGPGNSEEPPSRSSVEGKLDGEASSSVSSLLASVVTLSGMSKYQMVPKPVKRVNSLTCSQVKKARKQFRQTNKREEIFDKLTINQQRTTIQLNTSPIPAAFRCR